MVQPTLKRPPQLQQHTAVAQQAAVMVLPQPVLLDLDVEYVTDDKRQIKQNNTFAPSSS
jgi:hypothetical protein